MEWLVASFKQDYGIDLSKDRMALQRLSEAAEKAKIELSSARSRPTINLPFITARPLRAEAPADTLTRAKFEQLSGGPGREAHARAVRAGHVRRGARSRGHRRGDPGRRLDPHPRGADRW